MFTFVAVSSSIPSLIYKISSSLNGVAPSYTPSDKTVFQANCTHPNAPITTTRENLGGGTYLIEYFKDDQISKYVNESHERVRIVMESEISFV